MTDTEDINVIIADDEPLIRMDLKELLEESGYKVVGEAQNGQEAVTLAGEKTPDLIFLDIKMPEMDGIEAARKINEAANRRVPIIMLTAYSQPELYEEASKAGVFAYLTKPLRKADISPTIEVAIARALEVEGLSKEIADLQEKMEVRKLVERAKGVLMKRLGIDEPTSMKKLQKFSMDNRISIKEVAEKILDNK